MEVKVLRRLEDQQLLQVPREKRDQTHKGEEKPSKGLQGPGVKDWSQLPHPHDEILFGEVPMIKLLMLAMVVEAEVSWSSWPFPGTSDPATAASHLI